jgi:transposase-like protein
MMASCSGDSVAYMDFPREHRAKIHSTNPIERLNGEIKRRTDVVGIFPRACCFLEESGFPDRAEF